MDAGNANLGELLTCHSLFKLAQPQLPCQQHYDVTAARLIDSPAFPRMSHSLYGSEFETAYRLWAAAAPHSATDQERAPVNRNRCVLNFLL
jgi:hypothetical protein